MAKAAIASYIEMLESWRLKKLDDLSGDDYRDDDYNEDDYSDDYQTLCSLLHEKGTCSTFLIGLAKLWENNNFKLYRFLISVANITNIDEEKKLYSFVVEMTDIWEDDDHKESNLHSMLVEMADLWKSENIEDDRENQYSRLVEMAGVWKESKRKLSKEKLCTWLATKAGFWEGLPYEDQKKRFFPLPHDDLGYSWEVREWKEHHEVILEKVEKIVNDLMEINNMEENTTNYNYFISDALEMAHDAQILLGVLESVPFILFLEIMRLFNFHLTDYYEWLPEFPTDILLRKISVIQKCVCETRLRMMGLRVESRNVGEELVGPTTPTYSDHAAVPVGLEEQVELLLPDYKNTTTTCITGVGGIGKTTLARQVYNHAAVVDRYEFRAWVSLSLPELSRKELLIKLIRLLSQTNDDDDDMLMEKMDNISLRRMFNHRLQGRPFFIVLDDPSSYGTSYFEYLLQALPKDGGSLFFTIRGDIDEDVVCNNIHRMTYLDDDKSWRLLLRTALFESSRDGDGEFPKQLEKRAREMLKMCGGLPLAIKEMGKQWAEKRRHGAEWEQIVDSSMEDMDWSSTLAALDSTYQDLDMDGMSCFMRLAFFKEGTTIKSKKFLQICSAGGLAINRTPLWEFDKKSIIDEEWSGFDRRWFRINTVFHRLSITKAENGIGLGIEIRRKDGNTSRASDEPPHHRVVHFNREMVDYSCVDQDKYLVSLIFHGGGVCHSSYWNHFEKLKILDMEGFGLKTLPERLGELTELRYLGLRNNYVRELPQSLDRLKRLEVLDIAQNFMVEVADVIWEMDSLTHLYMSDISCPKPLKIDALKNLETLTYISVDNWTYETSRLQMMTRLRRLGIDEVDENSDVSKLVASLDGMKQLECLILKGFRSRSMPNLCYLSILHFVTQLKLEGRFTMLPSAHDFPPNLHHLSLVNSCLEEDPMPILENVFMLKHLELQNAYTGQQMVISPNAFTSLRNLVIGELWHLRNLQVGEGAMPCLNELNINSCPYLETIPTGGPGNWNFNSSSS